MKARFVFSLSCGLLLGFAVPRAASGAAQRLVVDDDKVECPNAGFTRIQDAVDAATPGAVLRVCKGTYVEQVTIHKPLRIEADSGAVLMPAAIQANASSLLDGSPLATAILVSDTTDVTIDGLTIDGVNHGISACAPRLFGIIVQNSSAEIARVAVRNFKLAANLAGCQSGTGIFVQSGGGGMSDVEIERSSVHDYQKNGITANEVGTKVSIRGNVVTGVGPTTGAAQNGIQLGFGAAGSISRNTVANNVWSPCVMAATCTAVATDILVTQSDGIEVRDNDAGVSQVNIFVDGNNSTVVANETSSSGVFEGIRIEGNGNEVRRNDVFNGAEAGIFIDGNSNVVENNVVTEANVGILKTTTSTGNVIQHNRVFDTPVAVQDPAAAKLAKVVSPER
jgi:nitrous oxidase accessory protein NosD